MQNNRKKDMILDAMQRLMNQNSARSISVSDVAKEAGIGKGSIYYYFKSKEEIVNEVVSVVMTELREASERILADDALTFYQKASEFLALYMDMIDQFSGDEEENLANMLEVFSRNSIAQDANDLLQEQISRLLEQGVKEKILTTAYPEETIRILIFGLLAQSRKQLLSMEQIMTIIEQAMHMPAGSLKKGGGE